MHVLTVERPDEPEALLVPVRDGETLDRALTRSGFVRPRKGCRRGGCGQCVVELSTGTTVDERPVAESALPSERRAAGFVLLCRAVPTSDVVVRFEPGQIHLASRLVYSVAAKELPKHPSLPVRRSPCPS